ncbi:MAG: hypothetical protein LLG14_23040 [Nocardiaceae bacterium]|nr:hypothetical protein [Nocardiaceae bacterium]
MNMVIPNEGKTLALDRWLDPDGNPGEDWIVRLYSNNYTPVDSSTLASFTEATFTGYSAVLVEMNDWGAASITTNVAYSTSSVTPSYTCTGGGGQTVYGWYAEGATSGKVLAAQRFDTARSMTPGSVEELDPFRVAFKTFT